MPEGDGSERDPNIYQWYPRAWSSEAGPFHHEDFGREHTWT